MHIGSDESYLSLERVGREGQRIVWRIQAAIAGAGCFAAVHRRAKVTAPDEARQRISEFGTHRAEQFKVMLSQGGWLRISRARRGHTLVRYRLGHLTGGASLEGRVRLEEESAEAFCRELGELLWQQ